MSSAALVPEFYVANIAESLAFYTGVLGFSVLYDRPAEGFAYLDHHGAEIMLEEIAGSDIAWLTGPMERPFGRGINFQIRTPVLDEILGRVPAAQVFRGVEEAWYETADGFAGQRQALVTDPDGYLLRFAEDLGRRAHPPKGVRSVTRQGPRHD